MDVRDKCQSKGLTWVGAQGPTKCKIAIVGEAPGAEEEKRGVPFCGGAGFLLDSVLSGAGIFREDVYITNVVKVRPPNNEIGKLGELGLAVSEFIPTLRDELVAVSPNVVVALGALAMEILTNERGIMKWRGSIVKSHLIEGLKVIPSVHPAAVLRQYKWRPLLQLDMKKVKRESESPLLNLPTRELMIQPTFIEVQDIISNIKKNYDRVAFDIEVGKQGIMSCISLSPSPKWSISIPFRNGYASYWHEGEELQIYRWLHELFNSDIKLIAQNALFDLMWLVPRLGYFTMYMDTMWAHQLCYAEIPKGLDILASIYTNEPYYKEERKVWKDTSITKQLWSYNCLMKGNRVITDYGSEEINYIVDNRLSVNVASLNEQTEEVEFKKVIGWHKAIVKDQKWIRIQTGKRYGNKRGLIATPEHRVKTIQGWKEAKDIKESDYIFINEPVITKEQVSVIIGTLLGDSSFGSKSDRLAYIEGQQVNKELVDLKNDLLSNIMLEVNPAIRDSGFKTNLFFGYCSKSMVQLKLLMQNMIIGGIKRPLYVLDILDSLGLAIWYMDDGCQQKPYRVRGHMGRSGFCKIAIQSYCNEDQEFIRDWFEARYNEKARIDQGNLAMSVPMSEKFCSEISEYVVPSLRYKLPFNYAPYKEPKIKQSNKAFYEKVDLVEEYKFIGKRRGYNNVRYCITVEDNNNFFTSYGLVSNCKDAVVTLEVALRLEEELKSLKLSDFFFGFVMRLLPVLLKMQMRGMRVDTQAREQIRSSLLQRKSEIESAFGKSLNLQSPKQLSTFLYDELGLPKQYHRKTGVLTTNKDALIKLRRKIK